MKRPTPITTTLTLLAAAPVIDAISTRANDGLARKPMMGWNSYNAYSCSISEDIIKSNTDAIVALGLDKAGYNYVTTDCGWSSEQRTKDGQITWNAKLFPSGFPGLGQYIHGKGLKFGVYADSGLRMCNPDQNSHQTGSLGYEEKDAATFASWEADMLKYDNCWSDVATYGNNPPNANYTPKQSPQPRYQRMRNALVATGRQIVFAVCEWGIDFPAAWVPGLAHSWRIGNDIIPSWKAIYRTLNQAATQTSFAGPGQWPDLDMLYVGNGIFTIPEEQTHFGMWAAVKSPLVVGAVLKDSQKSIPSASLAILKNKDAIGVNQDDLGVAASLRRRWTEDEMELWAGPLSGGRYVLNLINWSNTRRPMTIWFGDAGISSAGSVRDVWQAKTYNFKMSKYSATVEAHGSIMLILSDVTSGGYYSGQRAPTGSTIAGTYYPATAAKIVGGAQLTTCQTGKCYPVGSKIGFISSQSTVTFYNVDGGSEAGAKFSYLDFIQNDVNFEQTWTTGTNSRNLTISVNGGRPQRMDLPLTGKSSELFGLKGWQDSSVAVQILNGFVPGKKNTVVISNSAGGLVTWGADFVGLRIQE